MEDSSTVALTICNNLHSLSPGSKERGREHVSPHIENFQNPFSGTCTLRVREGNLCNDLVYYPLGNFLKMFVKLSIIFHLLNLAS